MNKITKLFIATFFGISVSGVAQSSRFCGTYEAMEKSFQEHPELRAQYLSEKAEMRKGSSETTNKEASAVIKTIPVVFHILHQGGTENITDAQIHDAMAILNRDYRMMNADTSVVVPVFKPIIADCEIEFRLAKKDPLGNCTNGIDRIYSAETNIGDEGSKLNPWPRNKYLNVWVVKTIASGAAGYFSGWWAASKDGIMILSNYVGSIGTGDVSRSRALTHEVGHFLNLDHTWGATNNPEVSCGDDGIGDTPITMGFTSCALSSSDVCTPGVEENLQNYMDYSYCSRMFTNGQKAAMISCLNSTAGQRSSLTTTSNLSATGVSLPSVLCKSDFFSSSATNTVCEGGSLTFTDIAYNGDPVSWNWTFPGGTPSSSTDSVPVIMYNTAGVYDVTLSVTNGSGTVAATKTSYVTVNPATAVYSGAFYFEGFEGGTLPSTDFKVRNNAPGGNTWVQTSTAAATGSKSAMITNSTSYDTYVDELIGPSIDMTMVTGPSVAMAFKVAHAQRTASSADKLSMYVSTNCGLTWSLRKVLTGAALSTGGVQSASFTPSATQWTQHVVSLASYASEDNLFFMFRFNSNGGNNVFLDDINITGSVGINELENDLNFNVYPNPAEDNTVVVFDLLEKKKVSIVITDVLGRQAASLYNGELAAGAHNYAVSEAGLSSGVYFVTLNVGGNKFTKKLIVK
ncbi:MAG: M43 family zinc metalloprotease [Bacteroidota bacterium]|nr:M43 family zinc metalloprotease [Bacteroidota bacterium]